MLNSGYNFEYILRNMNDKLGQMPRGLIIIMIMTISCAGILSVIFAAKNIKCCGRKPKTAIQERVISNFMCCYRQPTFWYYKYIINI